jgi:hypothetical protein
MTKPRGGRGRLIAAVGVVALAVGVAGCSQQASGTSTELAVGTPLTIYVSVPANPTAAQTAVVSGVQAAFTKLSSEVKGYKLQLIPLEGKTLSDNARKAIENLSTIAYIGELAHGASLETAGITESLDILELSPTDPVAVTKDDYEEYSTYGRTELSTAKLTPTGYPVHGEAAYGYQAMAILLEAMKKSGVHADNRGDVVKAVRKLI